MVTDDDALKRLNADMFAAENKELRGTESWEVFLQRVLSPDFRIRRFNGWVIQNKWEMIEQVRNDKVKRDGPTEVLVYVVGDYRIVTSVVTIRDDSNRDRYQNLKLFQRQSSADWQCVYWHVTGAITKTCG